MYRSIDELKIRAKKLQKRLNAGESEILSAFKLDVSAAQDLRRKTCLNQIAKQVGFIDWNHAKITLSGMSTPDSDMGKMWYSGQCTALLNNWFADYDEAQIYLAENPDMYLLPYKRQFMVVKDDFIKVIGLDQDCDEYWKKVNNNLVAAYGSNAWHELVWRRIQSY
ncbi:hypothetical protein RYZ26_02165 [Terasakiella sp. A23]|uniref:hypothetical protein n=1 Tax=Terasakiella sp. FCG-A23 TaxID=3080561 RepID=UPI00295369EA|nr:hypothetical protein [Terasakiella sp. A23]MDV7338384.1 hypothetical protein [Terasakiella sp. A23]